MSPVYGLDTVFEFKTKQPKSGLWIRFSDLVLTPYVETEYEEESRGPGLEERRYSWVSLG